MCTGNHDPYSYWQNELFSLPPNAHMFSAEEPSFFLFEKEGQPLCVLGGRGFLNKVWPSDVDVSAGITRQQAQATLGPCVQAAPFMVGVIHTGLDLDADKAPVSRRKLLSAGLDYWALGHIHKRMIITDDAGTPRLVFPGCIQGRDINETGTRSASIVTLTDDGSVSLKAVPTASIAYAQQQVDISDCETLPALLDRLTREQFNANGTCLCEKMISRITLTGKTPLHELVGRTDVREGLRNAANDAYPEFFVDAIVDRTSALMDKEALREEGLFPAILLQAADALRDDPEGTNAYLQEEFLRNGVALPQAPFDDLDRLFDEAEDAVLDLLAEGGAR